jgi:hypothetical protein
MMLLIAAPAWGQADGPGDTGLPPGLTPGPGQAARGAVLHQIEAIEAGEPDYGAMTPDEAAAFRSTIEPTLASFRQWGALEFLDFGYLWRGLYVYIATFDKAEVEFGIRPLDAEGKITALAFKTLSLSSAPDHKGPSPGTEAFLRRFIKSLEEGAPNYQEMGPGLIRTVRQQLSRALESIKQLGALKTISFLTVEPNGFNEYDVEFEHGQTIWWIAPLDAEGKADGLFFHKVPTGVSCCRVGSGP